MDVELARLSLESGEMARWAAVARDMGRHLAAQLDRSKAWLRPFRRLTAGLRPHRSSDYERGFLEALELVATGYERQLDDAAADETELLQLRAHPSWVAALRHIDHGVSRPSDLARKLGIVPSAVTKLIDELEDAQLVTQTSQGRERPCRLTPRARVLLPRLAPAEIDTALAEAAAKVVPGVVACMTALVRDRRVARQRLLECMRVTAQVDNPEQVLGVLDASLHEASCAVLDGDDAWVATDVELFGRLQQHLMLACRNRSGTIVDQLEALGGTEKVLLRVGNGVLTWDPAVASLGRVQVVHDDELRYAPHPLPSEFQIVYESPSLLVADRRQWPGWTAQALAAANGRYVFGVAPGPAIPDFNLIEVDAIEYAAEPAA